MLSPLLREFNLSINTSSSNSLSITDIILIADHMLFTSAYTHFIVLT
jgi:hypothetical protein